MVEPMAKRIELVANVSIVLLVVVLLAERFTARTTPSTVSEATQNADTYAVGEHLDLPGLDPSASEATLVLVVRSTCPYCTASMPFYSSLSAMRSANPDRRLVAASWEAEDVTRRYLEEHHVVVDKILSVSPKSLRVPGTPTVILVNGKGTVQGAWVGKLSETHEQEVFRSFVTRPTAR